MSDSATPFGVTVQGDWFVLVGCPSDRGESEILSLRDQLHSAKAATQMVLLREEINRQLGTPIPEDASVRGVHIHTNRIAIRDLYAAICETIERPDLMPHPGGGAFP